MAAEITLPWLWFDTISGGVDALVEGARGTEEAEQGGKLRCHLCRHAITEQGQRIAFQGGHTHTCTNPSGCVYDFGCYRNAPGCRHAGPCTDAHTWFAGYAWQIAVCGNCGEHLGWLFRGANRFYGLIAGRIVADAP